MSEADRIAELEKRVERLTHQLGVVEDTLAIRHLQHQYGYYLDKCLYDEVVDLYAEDGQVIFMGGVYKGRAGVARLYTGRFRNRFANGVNGPAHGQLLDHPQLQDVVHVDPDGRLAYGRFRSLMQAGNHESVTDGAPPRQWWEGGIYENTYVKESGVWKIKVLFYRPFWHATFERGWAHTPPEYIPNASATYPDDPHGPDELLEDPPQLWPHTETFPFHYPHPVTGGRPAETGPPHVP